MNNIFVLQIQGMPRMRIFFAATYLVSMASVASTGLSWPVKGCLLVVFFLAGYFTDSTFGRQAVGVFFPLRLIYDDSTIGGKSNKEDRGWRLRMADGPWTNIKLITYFNFFDVYLLMVFLNKDAFTGFGTFTNEDSGLSSRLKWLYADFRKSNIICLPLLLGDVPAEKLRRLRVLARLGD